VPVVDAWLQHPTNRLFAHPMFASLRRWLRIDEVPEHIPVEVTLAVMDEAGVDVALCSAWTGPQGPLISNDDVARFRDESGGRLQPVLSVDLRDPMGAVREIRRRAAEGFKGVRVLPWLWETPPDDRRFYPVYAACVDTGLPFLTQVGHTGPLMPSEPGRPIPYLDRVALDFPELVIVGGHVGWPWTSEMIALCTKYPNVYVDTSAYKASRWPPELVAYLKGHGRRKVLFGSNFPMITPAACLEGLDGLGLDDECRRLFLHDNAVRVFGLSG
jgi:predicted TIM-barrel fold metal-dependent hydrolase